ncbi:MAG: transketolase [Candidatus Aureabacteria bacterium]|nr:transketolase [Candidatus Auribacterota bacterium]
MDEKKIQHLKNTAQKVRRKIIEILGRAGSGHPGGSLSSTEIIVSLYEGIMDVDPSQPRKMQRDRLVLSKGHSCPALYVMLAFKGFFPVEDLDHLRQWGSHLQGHPDMKSTPGVDMSSGSLGQGLSAACGIALAAKIDKRDFWTYCIIGDGEAQEGQIWEASMFAAHNKLDNLIVFLDFNKQQIEGRVDEIIGPLQYEEKWKSFGWHVQTIDGHSFKEIFHAVDTAKKSRFKPFMIIANTVKGKGVSFMEWNLDFHGTAPKGTEIEKAISEINDSAF